jgi:hypothetical protein
MRQSGMAGITDAKCSQLIIQLSDEILKNPQQTPNPHFILADIVEPKKPKGSDNAVTIKADLTSAKEIDALFNTPLGVPDVIYCLHGIMSRGSEDNFDLGLKVSLESWKIFVQSQRSRLMYRSTSTPSASSSWLPATTKRHLAT